MIWQELLQAAFLGADRAGLSGAACETLAAYGLRKNSAPARLVLEGAAIVHQLRRAAFAFESFSGELPAPAATEGARPCGPRSSHHLKLILRGDFRPALPEFVDLLALSGQCLPPESLPGLFDQALADAALWNSLAPAIGPVGEWLLPQNAAWAPLRPGGGGDWFTGMRDERIGFLRRLRETDPEQAVGLLRQTWEQESPADKLLFLEAFDVAPGPADEAFLESLLDERRQELRLAAAERLSRLPDSALVARLFVAAAAQLRMEGARLTLVLPPRLDEALRRDGIREKPPRHYGASPRSGWLLQMLARIPPRFWRRHFNRPAPDCLTLFRQSDLGEAALTALGEAAARHPDDEWMEALLQYWIEQPDDAGWTGEAAAGLMRRLPPAAFHRIAGHHLANHNGFVDDRTPLARLLLLREHPWDDELALALIDGFQRWMAGTTPFAAGAAHYRELLRATAYRASPALLERLRRGWPLQARLWVRWEDDVEQFLSILAFRRDMIKSLEAGAANA